MMKNKKGVSVMIGYILLISFAIVIGALVYTQLKTYVPRETLECPDGVSLFVKDYTYNCSALNHELKLTIKNNGRFDIGGYFIHATNDSIQEVATIELDSYSNNFIPPGPGVIFGGVSIGANSFAPNDEETHIFTLDGVGFGKINNSIEIIPMRWQEEKNKLRIASCSPAKITERIVCS